MGPPQFPSTPAFEISLILILFGLPIGVLLGVVYDLFSKKRFPIPLNRVISSVLFGYLFSFVLYSIIAFANAGRMYESFFASVAVTSIPLAIGLQVGWIGMLFIRKLTGQQNSTQKKKR